MTENGPPTMPRLPAHERRRPALVVAFTMPQLALLAVTVVMLAVGLMFWMTAMAQYQAVSVDRLDAIRQQSALLRETVDAHVRVVQADNQAFIFYARAVCEQMAILSKRPTVLCHPEQQTPP